MWNIKALALTVQKLLARLKFPRGGQNDREDKNNMAPIFDLRGIKIAKIKKVIIYSYDNHLAQINLWHL